MEKPTKDDCPHDDWEIYGWNALGNATCAKCKGEFRFTELVTNWKARIERELNVAPSRPKST